MRSTDNDGDGRGVGELKAREKTKEDDSTNEQR